MRKHILQSPVLLEQFHRGLFANAGDARNVVGVIAHKTLQIAHAVGFETVLLLEHVAVKLDRLTDALLCHEHVCAFADELQRVAVSRDEQRIDSFRLAFARECAEDIVRLIARRFANGDAHLAEQLLEHRKLRP